MNEIHAAYSGVYGHDSLHGCPGPDSISDLPGRELVIRKIDRWIVII